MSKSDSHDRVIVFDTTLRDGEQAPGCSMHQAQKLQVAAALKDLGVDVIETGFPVASPGDFESVSAIAKQIEGPIICALARCSKEDIARTYEALRPAPRRRIHVFLATSPIHREFKLKMATEQIIRRAVDAVKWARDKFEDVEFSPEDAARTELDFLTEVVERVIEAGATTVNIPDTVGYAVPAQFGAAIRHLKTHVRGIDKAVLSVHCHDDLGMAVANSLAALMEGARQVECTINGLGERAGNCSLEEITMALRTRADYLKLRTGIRTERLYPTSRLVSKVTGLHVQRNKAIVGQNAFAHESGIHQHGVLAHPETYEIMKPEDVGFSSNSLVLGKHSGRNMLRQRLKDLGYHVDQAQLDKVFDDFKVLADKKKEIYDADLEALVQGTLDPTNLVREWELVDLSVSAGTGSLPSAAVCLRHRDGTKVKDAATGDGPVNAVFTCIERVTGINVTLRDYQVSSVTVGEDAQGDVLVEVEHPTGTFKGRAVNTDILVASGRAFLEALNRIAAKQSKLPPKREAVA